MKFLYIALITLLLWSCKTDTTEKKTDPVPEEPAPVAAAIEPQYPSMPVEEIKKLWDNGSYVDYIFHELPFSVSISDQPGIRNNLNYVANEPVRYDINKCKSLGREFFTVDGKTAWEAEIYFAPGCMHYVWHKDGKPVYANKMSKDGINFYGNLISQVKSSIPNVKK